MTWTERTGGHFGRFKIDAILGRGAHGVVLQATDTAVGRPVALKLLHGGERASHEQVERLRREAEALARLQHPNVVRVYESGAHEGVHFVVMELIEGKPLAKIFAEGAPLMTKLKLIEQAARGVHAAHRAGILHRDLKPSNVIVDAEGRARVLDFGLARLDDASIALTKTGASVGTPHYMAPELAAGDPKRLGPWSDVFSLGVMTFEALVGHVPYAGAGTIGELAVQLVSEAPVPRARSRKKDVPAALDDLCVRALKKVPAERIQDAGAFADALSAARRDGLERRPVRERRRVALIAGVLGLAVPVALALFLFVRPGTVKPGPLEIQLREPIADTLPIDGTVRVSGHTTGVLEIMANGTSVVVQPGGDFAAVIAVPPEVSEVLVLGRGPEGTEPVEVRRRIRRRLEAPSWYRALAEGDRPPLPLPRGIRFGDHHDEYVNERDGSVLIFVPGCRFTMGSDDGDEREKPRHSVELSPYFVGKYDVTIEQFTSFVAWTQYVTTAEVMGTGKIILQVVPGLFWANPRGADQPVLTGQPAVQISWYDAKAYADWAGLALPTEAQWERAAGWEPVTQHMRTYSWGDQPASAVSKLVGNVYDESLRRFAGGNAQPFDGYDDGFAFLAPVGSFPDGASPIGALDMTGNVVQWCEDAYDVSLYAHSPTEKDPVGHGPLDKSVRGSSWVNGPQLSRITRRGHVDPLDHGDTIGFRVALPLESH